MRCSLNVFFTEFYVIQNFYNEVFQDILIVTYSFYF